MGLRVLRADSADVSGAGDTPCSSPRQSSAAVAASAVSASAGRPAGARREHADSAFAAMVSQITASPYTCVTANCNAAGSQVSAEKCSSISDVRWNRADPGSIYDRHGSLIRDPDSAKWYEPFIPPEGIRQPWGEGSDEWWEFRVRCTAYEARYCAAAEDPEYLQNGRIAVLAKELKKLIHPEYLRKPRHKTIFDLLEDRVKMLTRLVRVRPPALRELGHGDKTAPEDHSMYSSICSYPGRHSERPKGIPGALALLKVMNQHRLDTTDGLYDPGRDHLAIAEAAYRSEVSSR